MKLTDEERAMLAGEFGPARQWAIKHQISVGNFFDAEDLVPVGQAHIMADTEATGESGVQFLESLAALPEEQRRVRIPTITDPRGVDFAAYKRLNQTERMADLEARANQYANLLRERGVGRGQLVGISLDRGVEMLAALLGALKAGAGYVPLDPAYPRERLAAMLDDFDADEHELLSLIYTLKMIRRLELVVPEPLPFAARR